MLISQQVTFIFMRVRFAFLEIIKNYKKLMCEIYSRRGGDSSRFFHFCSRQRSYREIDLTQNAHRSATRIYSLSVQTIILSLALVRTQISRNVRETVGLIVSR